MSETDDELRARLVYVAGDTREIAVAKGAELDAIAERYSLKRRGRASRDTQPISPYWGRLS